MRKYRLMLIVLVLVLSSTVIALAEETLTISTYYSSPYRVYNELRLFPKTAVPGDCNSNNVGAIRLMGRIGTQAWVLCAE